MSADLNLRHLSHLVTVCNSGMSVSTAATRLKIAQSVISRNIQALEKHFDALLFVRKGRRLTAMTPLCEAIIERARDINLRVQDLEQVAAAVSAQTASAEIRIACTHLQARYILPQVLKSIYRQHPHIKLIIHQCWPVDINDLLVSNRAELGICSEKLSDEAMMHSVEAYAWERALIMRPEHPLAKVRSLSIKRLATEPLVTYVHGITGRQQFDSTFAHQGLHPNVIIAAADSDVVKQFTREGLGVGVIAAIAYDPKLDKDLCVRRMPKQFGTMRSRIIHRHDRTLNDPQRLFIDAFCQESAALAQRSSGLLS